MKKTILIISLIIIIITISGVFIINKSISINPELKYSQEYTSGIGNIKGEVKIEQFTSKSENFDIGANKYGYAVFKDPDKAFKTLKKQYQKAIKLIQKEFNLMPLSKFNYKKYKIYGWQVKNGNAKEQEQSRFVSSFFDIYENSYKN